MRAADSLLSEPPDSMEYSSPIKKNEIGLFATTWVDLESIILIRKMLCRIKNKTGEYNKKETDTDNREQTSDCQ